jgi:hypothetical protein
MVLSGGRPFSSQLLAQGHPSRCHCHSRCPSHFPFLILRLSEELLEPELNLSMLGPKFIEKVVAYSKEISC